MSDLNAFTAAPTMALLRDFQRRTADYVFDRLYGTDPIYRFLIADEVGLGKTMVARGVIARAVEHLKPTVQRIDVVYICSNAAIAGQNIKRLNPVSDANLKEKATRLTLLPLDLAAYGLEKSRFNIVSFTPDTSLNLTSQGGTARERALIHWILADQGFGGAGLRNLLQCKAGKKAWDRRLAAGDERKYDKSLAEKFLAKLRRDETLLATLRLECERFGYFRETWPSEYAGGRYRLVGQLRHELATACLDALEPDLIILDEFQRFKELLTGDSPAAELARSLFDYSSNNARARTLLLSATPYRMPLQEADSTGDHYSDFIETLKFLYPQAAQLENTKQLFDAYRTALYGFEEGHEDEVLAARDAIQRALHQVMVRTERVDNTSALDAMVREQENPVTVRADEIRQARNLEKLAKELDARGALEYWKSAAYPLAFMSKYELAETMRDEMQSPPTAAFAACLRALQSTQPTKKQMARYKPIPMANGRLRALCKRTLDSGLGDVLWLCPSLPYYGLGEGWAALGANTKALVFSEWDMAPNGIAALLSYEAERRIREKAIPQVGRLSYRKFVKARRALRPLALDEGKPATMAQFTVLYPCVMLARSIDPLVLKCETLAQAVAESGEICEALLKPVHALPSSSAPEDLNWYWALLARLDAGIAAPSVDDLNAWFHPEANEDSGSAAEEPSPAAVAHLEQFNAVRAAAPAFGLLPGDHLEVLAYQAVGSPAVCALRMLGRVAPDLPLDDARLMRAAGRIAQAFRTFFNRPEASLMLTSRYGANVHPWRQVLQYCAEGNLQAVLDEYAHILIDALGLFDKSGPERAEALAEEIAAALTLRAARVDLHEIKQAGEAFVDEPHAVRCRFAMRLGELRDESIDNQKTRLEQVRQAFNSPFWPFVLASTSIGQEGLDFHPYCHAVWHWNLPGNPVDMEQREGRVHRYKGHAVRRNVAAQYGARARESAGGDPWRMMFEWARRDNADKSELIPYWVFEKAGGAVVERHVPMLPFSRETERYRALLRTLTLYRLAFGQPRQEDLIRWLSERSAEGQHPLNTDRWRIDLTPPAPLAGLVRSERELNQLLQSQQPQPAE